MSPKTSRTQPTNHRRNVHAGVGSSGGGGGRYTFGTVRPMVLLLAKALFVPLASAAPISSLWQRSVHTLEEDAPKSPDDPNLYAYLGIAVALVLLGGAFAGLTIALMGQDETYLQVIATSGEGSERKHAQKVLNLLKKGKHWVLVTLLLSNVITNETLPIVLDRSLGGGWPAVLSSTVLIVIFGEIAPQSVCVRYGLSIGSFMAPFVLGLMWIMSPVAWPTAKFLDWVLGEDHGTTYKKAGLKTLVSLHQTIGTTPGERLMDDEVTIINSVLDLKEKRVGDIMTPMQDVFTMSADTVLDERMMDIILSQGYSRIPIYLPDNNRNFLGMLLVKILLPYDPEDGKRVRDFALATLPETAPETSCLDIINFFQEGKSHMVLVSDYPGQDRGATGVVTLEDVIEELIGEEIIDESDVFVDVHKAIRRMAPAPQKRLHRSPGAEQRDTTDSESHDENGERRPLLTRGETTGSRKPSLTNGLKPTTFLMRRKSSTGSASTKDMPHRDGAVAVRSSTQEMREQLKHLGPSNVASRPKATKFTNVKIKPGVGTIPENHPTTTGVPAQGMQRSRSYDNPPSANIPFNADDEQKRLLRSAGKDASDGVPALYGTMDSPVPRKRGDSIPAEQMSATEASKMAEEKALSPPSTAGAGQPATSGQNGSSVPQNGDSQQDTTTTSQKGERENNFLSVPGKMVVGSTGSTGAEGEDDEGDTVGELAPSRERSKSRRAARSGSITEHEVEVGGMKKVVLEATSSSSDELEESQGSESKSASRTWLPQFDGPSGESSKDDKDGEDGDGEDAKKKKRKKRGKKKKGGDGGS